MANGRVDQLEPNHHDLIMIFDTFEDWLWDKARSGSQPLTVSDVAALSETSKEMHDIFSSALYGYAFSSYLEEMLNCSPEKVVESLNKQPTKFFAALLQKMQYEIAKKGEASGRDIACARGLLDRYDIQLDQPDEHDVTPLQRILGQNQFEKSQYDELTPFCMPPIESLKNHTKVVANTSAVERAYQADSFHHLNVIHDRVVNCYKIVGAIVGFTLFLAAGIAMWGGIVGLFFRVAGIAAMWGAVGGAALGFMVATLLICYDKKFADEILIFCDTAAKSLPDVIDGFAYASTYRNPIAFMPNTRARSKAASAMVTNTLGSLKESFADVFSRRNAASGNQMTHFNQGRRESSDQAVELQEMPRPAKLSTTASSFVSLDVSTLAIADPIDKEKQVATTSRVAKPIIVNDDFEDEMEEELVFKV